MGDRGKGKGGFIHYKLGQVGGSNGDEACERSTHPELPCISFWTIATVLCTLAHGVLAIDCPHPTLSRTVGKALE